MSPPTAKRRKDGSKSKKTKDTPPKPRLFIGSTVEALPLARAVHGELDHDLEVTIWNHGLIAAGQVTWSELVKQSSGFDFALFVFSGDDVVISRQNKADGIRDNVLIEYGLFVGVIGSDRVFFMYNRDKKPRTASDLAGVTPLTYADRTDGNHQAAVSPAADQIRKAASRLGRREIPANP